MTRPRMKGLKKDSDTFRVLGKEIHKTSIFFIAQILAFWILIAGFFVFLWLWYKQIRFS